MNLAPLLDALGERKMLIEFLYEQTRKVFDLTILEVEEWVCLRIDDFDSEEEFRMAAQEIIDKKYNNPEYSEARKLGRHTCEVITYDTEGEKIINSEEGIYLQATDKSLFTKYEDEHRHQEKVDEALEIARKILNKKQFELFYAIAYEGYSINEYALEKGTSENNISHKYCRILKKISKKRPIYISEVAY